MPYYRELAGDRVFRCSECGRRKHVKYVPKSDLCRDCAAKNRRQVENPTIELEKNLVVTKMVEKRFTKRAEKEIPLSKAEKIGDTISGWGPILFWVTSFFVARAFVAEWSGTFWIILLGWGILGTLGCIYITDLVLATPRKERANKIRLRLLELAEERKRKIEEAKQFYSSPEWTMLRKQVIKEKGKICTECGRKIKHNYDITVDHIKPRSKYPELSLSINNLCVMCRSCNAKKGDKELDELLNV